MEQFLESYGYLALFVGALSEGETFLVFAGIAAQQGWMSLPLVIVVAAIGGFIGDQFFFFLGRRYGERIFRRFPKLAAKAPRVQALLRRWDAPVVICIRFMYGLRVAGPIIIGTAGIPRWRLALFNLIGAIIWAPVITLIGYLAGHALENVLANLHQVEIILAVALIVGLAIGWLVYRRR